jgi:transposase
MSSSTRIHRSEVSFFPPCLDDLIDSDNPVRALEFYIEGLDLEDLGFKLKGKSELGRPIDYSGKDLLKLLIYGYLNQIRSSRKLAVETTRNLEVIWLLENARPRFWTINQFRKDNCTAFKNVLRNFHKVCDQLDLFGKELIAIDGSFYKARNNKARNFTTKKITRLDAKIDAAIDSYTEALDEGEKVEGASDDTGQNPEPAAQQSDPEAQPEPAAQQSDPEAQPKPDREEKLLGERGAEPEALAPEPEPPKNLKAEGSLEELKAKKKRIGELKEMAEQSPSGQVSLTDQDSRLLKKGSQSVVGHNIQCAIDSKHHLIADVDIVQSGNDHNQLAPMVQLACEALGIEPSEENPLDALVDGGYYNASQMSQCEQSGVRVFIPTVKKTTNHEPGYGIEDFTYNKETDEYICPAGNTLTRHKDTKLKEVNYQVYYNSAACRGCPFLEKCTKGQYRKLKISEFREVEEKIAARMEAEPTKYPQRMALAEHPFGTMKSIWGYSQFMVTGHPGCKGEISLMGFAHNWKRALKIVGMEKLMEAIALFIGNLLRKLALRALYRFSGQFA